jgi:poly-beta-1,6-N-acetyl-D-glucosamine synthase
MIPLRYVLITPARNEAQFIELTLKSVTSQTVLPLKWVIVSDGSTDGTDEIVKRYVAKYPWIELVRTPERAERHFAGKVHAFNTGYELLKSLDFDVIVSLDGDMSFDPDYFSFLLDRLASDAALGLIGTPFKEASQGTYDYRFVNIEHVSGACQVFRRACFESIGGYRPLKSGGIDHLAVITARMNGWKTRTFCDKYCLHHRHIGTAGHGAVAARFRYGVKDYLFGNHPVWEICRVGYQMTQKPYFIGGLALATGYLFAMIKGFERSVSLDAMRFQRREQLQRLGRFVRASAH